ncbi:hypothetical protein K469DRAFT_690383 [Zopfia rhizophila CBS 207.26]|uniref:Ecp2 effector protein domain-containing protein n=1 Tax=Zopfia rhizophila CBS 207.26 TaxID=1314779 RepID=A0A6A6DXF0_9PEZI|nr:hypothetical protein K469DRAFT_690383 [Zopfia rhizophila CBS 207.26]
MFIPIAVTILTLLSHHAEAIAIENCYRAHRPFKSTCALPDLRTMRNTLCSSTANWGEGFPFLSGHGVVLRMQDNCTTDNAPLGIDLTMTISSTFKDRNDCFNRTKSIIERCVDKGALGLNGGEWWDTDEPDQTFIWMQYQHIDPPAEPNPCYEYPSPPYCTEIPVAKREKTNVNVKDTAQGRRELALTGTVIDIDAEASVSFDERSCSPVSTDSMTTNIRNGTPNNITAQMVQNCVTSRLSRQSIIHPVRH